MFIPLIIEVHVKIEPLANQTNPLHLESKHPTIAPQDVF